MNTKLTPEQREMLRKVNLAQIHGLHSLANWLLKEYLLAYPTPNLPESLYVRLHGGK